MDIQKNDFEKVVSDFNNAIKDINIPIQKNYPPNYCFNLDYSFLFRENLLMGFGLDIAKTNAYALYGDAFGAVDFRGRFSTTLVSISLHGLLPIDLNRVFSIGAALKCGPFDYSLSAAITYPQFPEYNQSSEISDNGYLLCIEPQLNYAHRVYSFMWINAQVGYRVGGRMSDKADNNNVPAEFRVEEEEEVKFNPDGFVVSIGLLLTLPEITQ
ncbi:MAG: hypothetical protein HYV28_06865 [Ignavibacteriales bacterium]|nr:hypothetical protein [Ignavibacteriales bacterium]